MSSANQDETGNNDYINESDENNNNDQIEGKDGINENDDTGNNNDNNEDDNQDLKNANNNNDNSNEDDPNEKNDETSMNDNKLSIHEISKYQLPLQNRWTLWHTAPSSEVGGWSDNYKKICNFDTIGTFWRLFNNIAPPSMLQMGSSYHLFKGRVKPEWEDNYNSGGGSWTYRYSNDDTMEFWNYTWYHVALNMIGNNFEHYDEISGLVISIRKGGRGKLELWIRNATNEDVVFSIGKQFKQFIGINRNNVISFVSFKDAKLSSKKSEIKL